MTMNHPTYVSPMQWFFPFGNTAAVSLSQDLPPGKSLIALLLGNGDPRNILFTLFNDQNSRMQFQGNHVLMVEFSRAYDFTFCDIEPAIIARNVLLFTLLWDNKDSQIRPDYWSIFYDLHVDTPTLTTIRSHAANLVHVSETMTSWTSSPYWPILQICNTETLLLLREYWSKYSSYADPDHSAFYHFRKQCKDIYEMTPPGFTTQGLQMLSRSFGPRLIDAVSVTEHYTNMFWKTGIVRPSGQGLALRDRQANPLAMYSSSGDDRFALHYRSNPLAGFHLAGSLTLLAPDTPHFLEPRSEVRDNAPLVAKMQFEMWCNAFQDVAKKNASNKSGTGKLRIRFFIGDAIQFCTGLNHLRLGKDDQGLNMYSRPWSTQPLRFDGPAYLANAEDKAPLSFNIIDSSSLVDDVGFVNLLTATIPLLENSATSVLSTETLKSVPPQSEQPNLLTELFTADIGSMCALLGIVPIPYITGTTPGEKDPAYLDDHTPIFNRINWKISTSIDPSVNLRETRLLCHPESLAKLLFDVYLGMFAHETGAYLDRISGRARHSAGRMRFPQPHYTRKSFAVLLDFLRTRITVNWTDFWKYFITLLESDQELVLGKHSIQDLKLQCSLYGFDTLEKIDSSKTIYRHDRGVLKSENLLDITTLMINIPRRKLRMIYNACVETGHRVNMLFQIHLFHKSPSSPTSTVSTFASFQPIFGKYSVSDNIIDRDPMGWFGQSDLYLCAYVPTALLVERDPKRCEVVVRLQREMSCMMLLQDQLGSDLEVFRARLMSGEYIHLVERFPELKAPSMEVARGDDMKRFVVENEKVEVTYPELVPRDRAFTTEIILKGEKERKILNDEQLISLSQISPCQITIEYGDYKYTTSFPFPVTNPTIQINKASSSIKIIAPLESYKTNRSSLQIFYPLIHDKRYGLCTWDLPYINFAQLPRIAFVEYSTAKDTWFNPHLDSTYSDQECRIPATDTSIPLFEFKKSLYAVLEFIVHSDIYEPCVFTMKSPDKNLGGTLVFICTGISFESTTQSIVAEVYIMEVTEEVLYDPRFLPILAQTTSHDTEIEMSEGCYRLWRRALPAMAECCRDWEHQPTCEYKTPSSNETPKQLLCSCGAGKVSGDVTEIWPYAPNFVTRIAISPLFAAPYLESSKGGPLSGTPRKVLYRCVKKPKTTGDAKGGPLMEDLRCRDCGKEGQKKCGGCGVVYYCSRACQRRDWKKHKGECKKA